MGHRATGAASQLYRSHHVHNSVHVLQAGTGAQSAEGISLVSSRCNVLTAMAWVCTTWLYVVRSSLQPGQTLHRGLCSEICALVKHSIMMSVSARKNQ